MGPSRLHSLLYFCQGHHLADLTDPLFADPIYATGEGVLVDSTDEPDPAELDNGQLNTVGYVLSRYGNLSPADLRALVRGADPWRMANARPEDLLVELAWMRDWFRRAADHAEAGEPHLARAQVAALAERTRSLTPGPGRVDSREDLVARIAAAKGRVTNAP